MPYALSKKLKNERYRHAKITNGMPHGTTLYPRDNYVPTPPSERGTTRYSFKDLAGWAPTSKGTPANYGSASSLPVPTSPPWSTGEYLELGAIDPVTGREVETIKVPPPGTYKGKQTLSAVAYDAYRELYSLRKNLFTAMFTGKMMQTGFENGIYPVATFMDERFNKKRGIYVKFKNAGKFGMRTLAELDHVAVKDFVPARGVTDYIKDLGNGIVDAATDTLGFVGTTLSKIISGIGCKLANNDVAGLAATIGVSAGAGIPPEAVAGARAAAMRMCGIGQQDSSFFGSGSSILPIAAIGIAAYFMFIR